MRIGCSITDKLKNVWKKQNRTKRKNKKQKVAWIIHVRNDSIEKKTVKIKIILCWLADRASWNNLLYNGHASGRKQN